MCWSPEASAGIVVVGAAAAVFTCKRGDAPAIWGTMAYFTAMEALQFAGYLVVDDCGTAPNTSVTVLSYLHIVFQPFFINWFAMEIVPQTIKSSVRGWIFSLCAVSAGVILLQLVPWPGFGQCVAGSQLCGDAYCSVSGNWNIAWHVPYNGLLVPLETTLGTGTGFPTYMIAAFLLPLIYGAWRFVLLDAFVGPILALILNDNPNEIPAIWCLFSIAIVCIGSSPWIRRTVQAQTWRGMPVRGVEG